MTLLVSEEAAREVMRRADREPALAFNTFPPFYCRLCDEAVPPALMAGHLRVHRGELKALHDAAKAGAKVSV